MQKVIVVGGGAAGMAAAYAASFHAKEVLLVEQNEKLGKKIYITGKGRGNLTNAADIGEFFDKVISHPKFLYSALYGFSNERLLSLLGDYGLSTKTERGGRVFPVSDHASDITAAWKRALDDRNVAVRLNCKVRELLLAEDASAKDTDLSENAPVKGPDLAEAAPVKGPDLAETSSRKPRVCGVRLSDGEKIGADHVIVCTGGLSYPTTGSTGDGFRMAKRLGIGVTPTYPALVPLLTAQEDIPRMQGLSLKNVSITIRDNKKVLYREFGELLFTHFGISGPLVLSASSVVTKPLSEGKILSAGIDLKPKLDEATLDKRLLRIIEERHKQAFRRFFEDLLPGKMREVFVERTAIANDKRIGDLTKEERRRILDIMKNFSLTITGTGSFKEAIITQGGIDVREVDPATMRIKAVDGLSFAGEVLDVDALTGGYNMQIAFSTGFCAGDALGDAD